MALGDLPLNVTGGSALGGNPNALGGKTTSLSNFGVSTGGSKIMVLLVIAGAIGAFIWLKHHK